MVFSHICLASISSELIYIHGTVFICYCIAKTNFLHFISKAWVPSVQMKRDFFSLLLRFVFLVLCIWKCLQKETVVGISHASMMLTCHLLGKGCLSGFSLTSVLLLLCESWLRQMISSLSIEEPSLVKPFFEDLESECLMYFVFCESWYQIPESCPGYFVNRHKVFNLLLFQGEL